MKGNKRVIYFVFLCFVFLISIGVSYAYFSANVVGNETAKNINVGTTTLQLSYTDSLEISAQNIVPEWYAQKVITVENIGEGEVHYSLVFQNFKNTIINSELVISADCVGLNDSVCEGIEQTPIAVSDGSSDVIIKDGIRIGAHEKHNYTIVIEFLDDGIQNYNQGKEFVGVLGIKESHKTYDLKMNIKDNSGHALASKNVSLYANSTILTSDSNESLTFSNVNVGNYEIDIDGIKQKIVIDSANNEESNLSNGVYYLKAYQTSDALEVNVIISNDSVSDIQIVPSINCTNKTLANCLIDNYNLFGLTKINQSQTGNQDYDTVEYRYQGKTPNNYISFNNEDAWRIIGVFEVKTYLNNNELDTYDKNFIKEYKVKLVRDSLSSTNKWTLVKMTGKNANSWDTSTLKTYLNSGEFFSSLTDDARNRISNTRWYISNVTNSKNLSDIYNEERSNNVFSKNYSLWNGKVGLIYPSDYMYASSECYLTTQSASSYNSCNSSNWLYDTNNYFTISPSSTSEDYVMRVLADGSCNYIDAISEYNIRPTVYLSTTSRYSSGDGSSANPFVLR